MRAFLPTGAVVVLSRKVTIRISINANMNIEEVLLKIKEKNEASLYSSSQGHDTSRKEKKKKNIQIHILHACGLTPCQSRLIRPVDVHFFVRFFVCRHGCDLRSYHACPTPEARLGDRKVHRATRHLPSKWGETSRWTMIGGSRGVVGDDSNGSRWWEERLWVASAVSEARQSAEITDSRGECW